MRIGIVGAGPAGSIVANYLAKEGIEAVMFEKSTFPRFHVGESLNPAVMHILKELNITEEMLGAESCAKKYHVMWTLPRKEFSYPLNPVALQVERGKFDEVLLKSSLKNGAKLVICNVTDINIDQAKPTITYTKDDKETIESFDFVIDASGRSAILATKLNRVHRIPEYDQIAVHARFTDYEFPESEQENTVLHYLREKEGWCWQFPIGKNLYSVGVVVPRSRVTNMKNLEEFFWDNLSQRPDVAERLKKAKCITEYRNDANYTYYVSKAYGNNYAMIGDAGGYIDPIFSAGIGVASHAAKFLAKDLININKNKLELKEANLNTYTTKMKIGFYNWRSIIFCYYRLQVAMTYFIVHTDHSRLVKNLLNGELYDEVQVELIARIREMIETVENNPEHPWYAFLNKKVPLLPDLD